MAGGLEVVDDGGGEGIDNGVGSGCSNLNLGMVGLDGSEDRVDKQSARHVDGRRVQLGLDSRAEPAKLEAVVALLQSKAAISRLNRLVRLEVEK